MGKRTVVCFVLAVTLSALVAVGDLGPFPKRVVVRKAAPKPLVSNPGIPDGPAARVKEGGPRDSGLTVITPARELPGRIWQPPLNASTLPSGGAAFEPMSGIRMQSAEVEVRFRRAVAKDLAPATQPAGELTRPIAGQWVVADVACQFEMVCTEANESFMIGFPLYATGDPEFRVTRFAVDVNGTPVEEIAPAFGWTIEDAAAKKPSDPSAAKTPPRLYNGFEWPASAVKGATQFIVVDYGLLLSVTEGRASFRYVLRSGALWEGTVGRQTVTVRAEPCLAVRPRPSKVLPAAQQKDGSWVYTLTDAEPTLDIVMDIDAPAQDKTPVAAASAAGGVRAK